MKKYLEKQNDIVNFEKMIEYKKENKGEWDATAYNGRFHASGAVTPQTILCGFERLSPAASAVEAPPA